MLLLDYRVPSHPDRKITGKMTENAGYLYNSRWQPPLITYHVSLQKCKSYDCKLLDSLGELIALPVEKK